MRESDGARGRRASQSEPSAHDEREWQGRRHDGNASGYSGWEQPHEVSRYPPGHSLRTNNLESLAPPPTTGGRDAFSGLGTRGGGASTRGTHDFHRQSFPPRTARNDMYDAVRAPAPAPAPGSAIYGVDGFRSGARASLGDDRNTSHENCKLLLHGYPQRTTEEDVRRAFERNEVTVVDIRVFSELTYAYELRNESQDRSGTYFVAAYARVADSSGAERMLEFINRGGPRGGGVTFRGATLGGDFWNAQRPKHLRNIPREPLGRTGQRDSGPYGHLDAQRGVRVFARQPSRDAKPTEFSNLPTPNSFSRFVDVRGQMGRVIGKGGKCVKLIMADTGCEISKHSDGVRMTVEGKSLEDVARGVERVDEEVAKWVDYGKNFAKATVSPMTSKNKREGTDKKNQELPLLGLEHGERGQDTLTNARGSCGAQRAEDEAPEDGEIVPPTLRKQTKTFRNAGDAAKAAGRVRDPKGCFAASAVGTKPLHTPDSTKKNSPPPPPPQEVSHVCSTPARQAAGESVCGGDTARTKTPVPAASPIETLASLLADRQIPRDSLVRHVTGGLEHAGVSCDLHSVASKLSNTLRNLFVRYRVSKTLESSKYRLGKIVRLVAVDSTLTQGIAGTSSQTNLDIQAWRLVLELCDACCDGKGTDDTEGRKQSTREETAAVALVSNVAASALETTRWLSRRFAGDAFAAVASLTKDVLDTHTARKRAAAEGTASQDATRGGKQGRKSC